MNISRKKRQIFIVFVDILILVFSIFIALFLRNGRVPSAENFFKHLFYFIPLILFWIICFYTLGLYSLEMPYTADKTISLIGITALLSVLIGFALFYLIPSAEIFPKTVMVLYSCISFGLISFWRQLLNTIFLKFFPKINIAFAGINETVVDLLKNMENFSYMSYDTLFLFDEEYPEDFCYGVPVLRDPACFITKIMENKVQMVVLAGEKNTPPSFRNALFNLLQHNVRFIDLPEFYEIFLRKIPIGAVNELWFLRNINLESKQQYAIFKRIFDIILSFIALVVVIPFWPFIMLIIKLESPGPIFFKQIRLGYLGKEFTILKFRTMRINDNNFAPTDKGDPRITAFGNFMRKTRIDELPQFINILKGDMSFIGPRPERPELVRELEKKVPYYLQRTLVKPGITGWDQVSGEYHSPSVEDTYKKVQYDLYYIKNMSLFFDISVFFKTIKTVLRRAGR